MIRIFLLLSLFCCGCIVKEYPVSYQLKNFVYFEKQPDDITCGPTCASMVLNYYGKSVKCSDVENYVLHKTNLMGKRIGFSLPHGIANGLDHFGVKSKVSRSNLFHIKWNVSNDRPVIVLLRSETDLWHYVIVIGYTKEDILIADPDSGQKEWMLTKNFLSSWKFTTDMRGDHVGSLCWLCKGSGKFLLLPCDVCLGNGYIDTYRTAIRTAGIYSNTMIVPNK